jgi:hypothetical protein
VEIAGTPEITSSYDYFSGDTGTWTAYSYKNPELNITYKVPETVLKFSDGSTKTIGGIDETYNTLMSPEDDVFGKYFGAQDGDTVNLYINISYYGTQADIWISPTPVQVVDIDTPSNCEVTVCIGYIELRHTLAPDFSLWYSSGTTITNTNITF